MSAAFQREKGLKRRGCEKKEAKKQFPGYPHQPFFAQNFAPTKSQLIPSSIHPTNRHASPPPPTRQTGTGGQSPSKLQ